MRSVGRRRGSRPATGSSGSCRLPGRSSSPDRRSFRRGRRCAKPASRCLLGLFGKGLVGLRERQQFLDPVDALGRDQAELREMTAQRIDGHGSLLDQQFPSLVQHQHGLLIRALDRHEPHLGPRHGLADRSRVIRIVLAALKIRKGGPYRIASKSCHCAYGLTPRLLSPNTCVPLGEGARIDKHGRNPRRSHLLPYRAC